MPDEWQTMPIKFLKWYEEVAKKQKSMRMDMEEEEEEEESGRGGSIGGESLPSASSASAGVDINGDSVSKTHSLSTSDCSVSPSTPSTSMKRLLTIDDDETSPRSKQKRVDDASPSKMRNTLALEEAFRSTSEIFPSIAVDSLLLGKCGKAATRFTIGSEGECTIDRIQEGFFTTFVVEGKEEEEEEEERRREEFALRLRRVDKCVAKMKEFLPKQSLLVVVLAGRDATSEERQRGLVDAVLNGVVFADLT